MSETYAEKLKDPRWARKRDQIVARDGGRCRVCNTTENLHVHHIHYIKGREPWEYKDFYLVTLCGKHHEQEHEELRKSFDPPDSPVRQATEPIIPEPIRELVAEYELAIEKMSRHGISSPEIHAGFDRLNGIMAEIKELGFTPFHSGAGKRSWRPRRK